MSGTKAGTGLALTAGGSRPLQVYGRISVLPPHQRMGPVQYDHPIGGLCHYLPLPGQESHHGSSHQKDRIPGSHLTPMAHHILQKSSQGNSYRHRMLHLSHYRNQLIRHGMLLFHGTVYIIHRFHIQHHHALLNGKTSRADNLSQSFIDQYNLVSHRIGALQQLQPHLGISIYISIHSLTCGLIFFFYPDDYLPGSHCPGDLIKGFQYFLCMPLQELPVQLQKRLTFRTVHQNDLRPFIQLGIGRKPGAAGPHNASLLQKLF